MRHGTQIVDIEHALMRLAVLTDQTGTIHGKNDVEVQHGDILKEHIVCPLQKGRIDRHNRDHSLHGKSARHRNGMSLRDADIKAAFGIFLGKLRQTRAVYHRSGDRAYAGLFLRDLAERFAEGLGERRQMRAQRRLPALGVKGADAMEHIGIRLRRRIALALLRDHMEQHGLFTRLDQLQHILQPCKIVPVHRAVILKAHLLKQRRAEEHPLPTLLEAVCEAVNRLAAGQCVRHRAVGFF